MVACPDCGTPNRTDADLCVQCWREMTAGAVSKIPVVAYAASAAAPVSPPPPSAPPRYLAPRKAPQPVLPREEKPGPVPYFAPVGSNGSTAPVGFPLPSAPSPTSPTTTTGFPWGSIVALVLVFAILGGGYYFLFGRSAGAFSPENGAYTVSLPDGWERVEELEGARQEIDVAIRAEGSGDAADTGIIVGQVPVPDGIATEQLKLGMTYAQQFIPKIPGLSIGPIQESTVVTGEGVSAYELTATASESLATGGGKVRLVFAMKDGASNVALLMVTCNEAECADAEATFAEMAKTFEFSG